MPRPRGWERDADPNLLAAAEAMLAAGESQAKVAEWLCSQGVQVTRSAVRDWRARSKRPGLATMTAVPDSPAGAGCAPPAPPPLPPGWTSGMTVHPDGRRTINGVTSSPIEVDGDDWHARLLAMDGLDPAEWVIVGDVRVEHRHDPAAWHRDGQGQDAVTRPVVRSRYSYMVAPRVDGPAARADVDDLVRAAGRRRPARKRQGQGPSVALLVALADWQLGKGEGGGSAAAVDRIVAALDLIPDRVKSLRRDGWNVTEIVLAGLGDLVEGCSGHYDMQTFQTDLSQREQDRVARRLILRAVDTAVDTGVETVTLAAVAGNHGENRRDGRAYTTWSDNRDLAVVEQVAEIIAANPDRYGHVRTILSNADEDLALTIQIQGVPVAFAHGHQFPGGQAHAAGKAEKWWQGQVMGRRPAGQARILIAGHLHHLVVSTATGRTFVQAPAMDGGSAWWRHRTGADSPAGMLTLVVGTEAGPLGWTGLEVLGSDERFAA